MSSDDIVMIPAKVCDNCKSVYPQNYTICEKCGSRLREGSVPVSKHQLKQYMAMKGIKPGKSSYSTSSGGNCNAGSWVLRIVVFVVLSVIISIIAYFVD